MCLHGEQQKQKTKKNGLSRNVLSSDQTDEHLLRRDILITRIPLP